MYLFDIANHCISSSAVYGGSVFQGQPILEDLHKWKVKDGEVKNWCAHIVMVLPYAYYINALEH